MQLGYKYKIRESKNDTNSKTNVFVNTLVFDINRSKLDLGEFFHFKSSRFKL